MEWSYRARTLTIVLSLALPAVWLAGCGPRTHAPPPPESEMVVPPAKPGVYLRASCDDDPSDLLGRFLPDGIAADQLDEGDGMQTRCSRYITYKEVGTGGGFTYVEYFKASRGLRASLGVSGVGTASGGYGDDASMLVHYTLAKKMRAVVSDPDALDRCCAAAPGQCTELYLGEFLLGSGRIMRAVGTEADFQAGGSYSGVTAELEFKDGVTWKQLTSFDGCYFAFKTARHVPAAGGPCGGEWWAEPPTSLDGQYFVGISPPAATQDLARSRAMRSARVQVVRYLGEYLTSRMSSRATALEGYLEDESLVTNVSEGLASRVKDRCWAQPEVVETVGGTRYIARVLAFFRKDQEEAAAAATLAAIAAELERKGTPDPELAEQAKSMMEK